jgi:ureidoglycolate hydrolase
LESQAIEIRNFSGEGYQSVLNFESWRVAVLRYHDGSHPDKIHTIERHCQTDEVFILTEGRAVLIVGGTGDEVGELQAVAMQPGKIYNIKKNAWHTTLLGKGAHIIIVENDDTSKENSESTALTNSHRDALQAIANDFWAGN